MIINHHVGFVLDGEHDGGPTRLWAYLPAVADVIVFSPDCSATVVVRWYDATAERWELHVERDTDLLMTAAEAAAWRRCGFSVPDPPVRSAAAPPWKEL